MPSVQDRLQIVEQWPQENKHGSDQQNPNDLHGNRNHCGHQHHEDNICLFGFHSFGPGKLEFTVAKQGLPKHHQDEKNK